MLKRLAIFLGILLGLLSATWLSAQPFPTPISQAIALLTSGTTPFEIVRLIEDGYINFGSDSEADGYGLRDNAGDIEFKNDGGAWTALPSSGLSPSDATYIVQTANAGLSAEQVLGSLASALLVNTTTTGVLSAYTGTSCTNEVATALSALGVATCDPVTLTTMVTGTLPVANGGTGAATLTGLPLGSGTSAFTAITSSTVGQVLRVTAANTFAFGAVDLDDTDAITGTLAVANGGTNLASGTSGGVLYYSASGTLASSGALSANLLVLGGGAGAAPTSLSCASATTVLHGGTPPTCSAVNLATDVTGSIGVTTGGTGLSSFATGDLIQATAADTLSALASVSAGSFLRSGGVTTASVWSTTKWPNAATTGDILYASGTNQYANLADVAVGSVLVSGGVGTAPAYSATPTVTSLTLTTALIGPGTEAAAGVIRLANTSLIAARNAGDLADVTLLTLTAGDAVQLGSSGASGLVFVGTNSYYVRVATPTIASGFGTTPAIAGHASAFKVTVGGGGDTTGLVTFATTWPTAPVCTANNETTAQMVRATPTTTQVTLAGTMAASDVVSVLCVGY